MKRHRLLSNEVMEEKFILKTYTLLYLQQVFLLFMVSFPFTFSLYKLLQHTKGQTKLHKCIKKKLVGNTFNSTVKWFVLLQYHSANTTVQCVGLLKYLLFLVEVCEYRKTSFASELGTPHNDGLTCCDGNIQISRISLTYLENQTQNIHISHSHTPKKQNIL